MVAHLANLTRWEWFKLRRRWMPWVLLAVITLFSQIPLWGNFFEYRSQSGSDETMMEIRIREPGHLIDEGSPIFVMVSCADLLAGREPPLPPGTDRSRIEEVRSSCELDEALDKLDCADLEGAADSLPPDVDPAFVGHLQRTCQMDAIMEGSNCRELLAGIEPDIPPGTEPDLLLDIRSACEQVDEFGPDYLDESRLNFALPNSLVWAFAVGQVFGLLLLAILTASALGSEYGWGTLRPTLVKGTGRWQYLTAKLVLLALMAVGAMALVALVTVIGSLLALHLTPDRPASFGAPPPWAATGKMAWSETAIIMGRTMFSLIPYLALVVAVTVLTASAAAGMAVGLGYYFLETTTAAILINLFSKFDTVADYLLLRNITAWMLGSASDGTTSEALGGPFNFGDYPGELHALLVLLAYTAFFIGVAFWRFQRKDISAATGG